jgi:hypothetical protein
MDISFEGYESPSSITENRKNVKDLVIEMTVEPRQAWIDAWEPAVKYSNVRLESCITDKVMFIAPEDLFFFKVK